MEQKPKQEYQVALTYDEITAIRRILQYVPCSYREEWAAKLITCPIDCKGHNLCLEYAEKFSEVIDGRR